MGFASKLTSQFKTTLNLPCMKSKKSFMKVVGTLDGVPPPK